MSKTRAYINIFSLDEENVIKRNPAVSYAAEQGQDMVDQMRICNEKSWLLRMISYKDTVSLMTKPGSSGNNN